MLVAQRDAQLIADAERPENIEEPQAAIVCGSRARALQHR
jgi:hypothetical protein